MFKGTWAIHLITVKHVMRIPSNTLLHYRFPLILGRFNANHFPPK